MVGAQTELRGPGVASVSVAATKARDTPGLLERGAVFFTLFVGTGAMISLFTLPNPQGDPWASSAENPVSRAMWICIYLVMLYWLVPVSQQVITLMRRNIWIPILMLLVLVSVLWSPTPGVTLRRGVAIDLSAIYGYYLAIRFTTRQIVELLAIALALALLMSVVFIVALPSYGVYNDIFRGPTWRGVFLQSSPSVMRLHWASWHSLLLRHLGLGSSSFR